MFGIELITPPSLVVLAGLFTCGAKAEPAVRTRITATGVAYNLSRSSAQLQGFDIDTVSPYRAGEHTKIGGLTGGEITISTDISMSVTKNLIVKKSCVWLDTVDIRIKSEPTVYIASEYKPGTCRYRTTVEHELKHVAVDAKLLDEFAPKIESAARLAAKNAAPDRPVPTSGLESVRADINRKIEEALKEPIAELHIERRKRQQAIDTREEYDRLSRQCGNQF